MPAFYKDLDLGESEILFGSHVLIVQDAVSHTSGWQTLHCLVEAILALCLGQNIGASRIA